MKLWQRLLPDPAKGWKEMADETMLAITVWGEARGTTFRCKIAVASVIRNRALHSSWWGSGWKDVILKPLQFSIFNATDPNQHKLKEPLRYDSQDAWEECAIAAQLVYADLVLDPTHGADHYFSGEKVPSWATDKTPTLTLDGMRFFRLSLPEPSEAGNGA
jgi:spore germination cell wall hydrolase CwlJ-like protein